MFINQFGIWASQVADSTGETYNLTQEGSDLILLEGNSDELLTEAYPDIYRVLQEGAFPIFQEDGARLLQEDYVPPPLLLDTYSTDVYAAYSVRELNRSYSGDCLRIREDGGDTEIDIGFSDGWIDTAAIASHCGANNGYVVKWYDQSGNSKDLIQSTAASQPQIYNGSSTFTASNGYAEIRFDQTDDIMGYEGSAAGVGQSGSSDYTVWGISTTYGWSDTVHASEHYRVQMYGSSRPSAIEFIAWTTSARLNGEVSDNDEFISCSRLDWAADNASSIKFRLNNGTDATGSNAVSQAVRSDISIGARPVAYNVQIGSAGTFLDLSIQEHVTWDGSHSDSTTSDIIDNQNTAFSIY